MQLGVRISLGLLSSVNRGEASGVPPPSHDTVVHQLKQSLLAAKKIVTVEPSSHMLLGKLLIVVEVLFYLCFIIHIKVLVWNVWRAGKSSFNFVFSRLG